MSVGDNGVGNLTISTGGTVSSTTSFVGNNAGSTGVVNVSGGSWTDLNLLSVGVEGNGTFNLSGGLVTSQSTTVGGQAGGNGTVNLTGGVLATGQMQESFGNGIVTFNGGTLRLTGNQTNLFIGFQVGDVQLVGTGGTIDTNGFTVATALGLTGNGSLTKQGNGTLTLTGNNSYTGRTTARNGTLEVTGGGSISHAARDLIVGRFSGDNATFTLSNGTVSNANGLLGADFGSTGVVNVSGGNWTNAEDVVVGFQGNGTLNVSGGSVASSATIVGLNAPGSGMVNLTGGVLATGQISEGDGNGTVTFNGGTLRLTGNQTNLFAGFESGDVTLANNGGTNDTNGFAVETAYALTGNGSLIKQGNGTLTLTGNNSYQGNTFNISGTTVRNGTLEVTDGGASTMPQAIWPSV